MQLEDDGADLSFIFTTIARNDCARRLIDSAAARFPRLRLLVADQNEPTETMAAFYRQRKVEVHWAPFDFGVSAGRSLLARRVTTPYLVFGDDDYVFTERTRFAPVKAYLQARPEVALVTGAWVDSWGDKQGRVRRETRRYECLLYRDRAHRGLIALPIDYLRPEVDAYGGEVFYRCDLGLNWAMARTSLFDDERFLWDSRFKSNGEHENFFLQLKEQGGGHVMYYPLMECDHRPEAPSGYMQLRNREEGWIAFARKWDVDWFFLAGKSFHLYSNYGGSAVGHAPAGPGFSSFLPRRGDDYLRIWAHGLATASVSDAAILRDAARTEKTVRDKAARRIEGMGERLARLEAENRRLAGVNEELRGKLKDATAEARQRRAALEELRERVRQLSAGQARAHQGS